MWLDLFLYIFVYVIWIIYIVNSLIQNKKMNHYLPNKKLELLTIPFYVLAIASFYNLNSSLAKIFSNKFVSNYNLSTGFNIIIGIFFLIFATALYIYANFFEKSFPSCITTKNNGELAGIYKYVRHPSFYIFFFITFGTAFCLQSLSIFMLAVINHICIYFYYMVEEKQIRKTNHYYDEYLKKTNRFLPNFIKLKK